MKTYSAKRHAAITMAPKTPVYSFAFFFKFIVALTLLLTTFLKAANAQCHPPSMTFNSPVLITGTDGQVGAVYLFPNVTTGVDAQVEVIGIYGGAGLTEIDNTTGAGYYDAFQPYVLAGANDTSYIDWKITFKIAGTSTDTVLACLAVTGVDVDGDNSALQEFIEAETPGSFAVDPYTNLQVSFDGVRSKAVSPVANIALIDTAHREAMFQMNFTNISTLRYRNGAITTGGAQTRQTCIYFKSFFDNYIMLLPVKLLSFTAKLSNKETVLNWSATDETDTRSYTVQKSADGITWKDINTVSRGVSGTINNYFVTDIEKNTVVVYYRLKQSDIKGSFTYSTIIKVVPGNLSATLITNNTMISNGVNIQVNTPVNDEYNTAIYAVNGNKIKQQQNKVYAGANSIAIPVEGEMAKGIYILVIKNNKGQQVYTSKLVRN